MSTLRTDSLKEGIYLKKAIPDGKDVIWLIVKVTKKLDGALSIDAIRWWGDKTRIYKDELTLGDSLDEGIELYHPDEEEQVMLAIKAL